MPREKPLLKLLSKHYPPLAMIDMKYKNLDITFKTDKEGNPVLMLSVKGRRMALFPGEGFLGRL
jgi:hypothetical protein